MEAVTESEKRFGLQQGKHGLGSLPGLQIFVRASYGIEYSMLVRTEESMTTSKPRYVVRDAQGQAVRETESRLVAWWVWFSRRNFGYTAHDRRSWVEDELSWLRCGDLPSAK